MALRKSAKLVCLNLAARHVCNRRRQSIASCYKVASNDSCPNGDELLAALNLYMKAKQSAGTLDDMHLVSKRSFRPTPLLQADKSCLQHWKSTVASKGGILLPAVFPRDSFPQLSSAQPAVSNTDKQRTPVPFYERGKPNWDQLQHVIYRLNETVPWFFQRQLDLTFYAEDVLFINRVHGTEVQGLRHYWIYLGTLALMYRFPCPYIEMKVISCHPIVDEGSVRLRWRAQYLGVLEFLTVTARARSTDIEVYRKHCRWFDGVSSFYVGADGLVYKHVADTVMRDPEEYESGKRKFGLLSKIFGISPKPSGAIA